MAAIVELGAGEHAGTGEHRLQRLQPTLVVAPRRLCFVALPAPDGVDQRELELGPVVVPVVVGGDRHGEGAQLPRLLEAELVTIAGQLDDQLLDTPPGVADLGRVGPHPGEAPGPAGRPTPIIESRVASAASSTSVIASVPAGRCGSTQYRSSALESHTRISTESGTS